MIGAIIMASGFSTRMGKNKLLLPLNGKTVIEHIIDEVKKCPFSKIVLIAKDEAVIDIGKHKNIKVVINKQAEIGQSESIKLGLQALSDLSGYAFFTGDQPLIDANTIKEIMKVFIHHENQIVIPRYKKRQGSPVIFPLELKNELLSLTGDVGGKAVIKKHLDIIEYVDINHDSFFWDIDTKEDFLKVLEFIRDGRNE